MTSIAPRLAYEEGIRWLAELDAMLERYRTRSAGFLAVSIIAGGVGLSGLDTASENPPVVWLAVIGAGLAATLTAAVATAWRVKGPFRLSASRIVDYGHDDSFRTDDEVYEDLALWLEKNTNELYKRINMRSRMQYLGMAGVVVVLVGVAVLRTAAMY